MFYDQDEERLARARLVAESLVPDMELWRQEMVVWFGPTRLELLMDILDYREEE